MDEMPCPYVNALLGGPHACRFADEVTRRSGPAVLCQNAAAHPRCLAVYEQAKATALPALGYEDDLLSLPHSMLVKVQFGTLLGLRALQQGSETAGEPIEDVARLMAETETTYGDIQQIPYSELISSIEQYRLQRRRSRS